VQREILKIVLSTANGKDNSGNFSHYLINQKQQNTTVQRQKIQTNSEYMKAWNIRVFKSDCDNIRQLQALCWMLLTDAIMEWKKIDVYWPECPL